MPLVLVPAAKLMLHRNQNTTSTTPLLSASPLVLPLCFSSWWSNTLTTLPSLTRSYIHTSLHAQVRAYLFTCIHTYVPLEIMSAQSHDDCIINHVLLTHIYIYRNKSTFDVLLTIFRCCVGDVSRGVHCVNL